MKTPNCYHIDHWLFKVTSLILGFSLTLTSCHPIVKKSEASDNPSKTIQKPKVSIDRAGQVIQLKNGCGYNDRPVIADIKINAPTYREMDEIKSILIYTGLPLSFKIYSANVKYAIATIIDGERYIIYNPKLLDETDSKSESYFTSMSIVAHEIGHHLAGHTLKPSGELLTSELEADRFSGFVLNRMGATINDATKALSLIAKIESSNTHPGRAERIKAVEAGWKDAEELKKQNAIPPAPQDLSDQDREIFEFNPGVFIEDTVKTKDYFEREKRRDSIRKITYTTYQAKSGKTYTVSPKLYGIVIELLDGSANILVKGKVRHFKEDMTQYINKNLIIGINYPNTTSAEIGNFEFLLVPGRRILFAYDIQDSCHCKQLIYLKPLAAASKIDK